MSFVKFAELWDSRRITGRSHDLVAVGPCHDEQVADHGASESPSYPFCVYRRHNLADELRAGGCRGQDDPIVDFVDRIADTIEDEAVAGIGVWSGHLRERCLRSVSESPPQDREFVVPAPTNGNKEKSRRPSFMMGSRNRALIVLGCIPALYNVPVASPDCSVCCEEEPSVLLGPRMSWSSGAHPVGEPAYSWLSLSVPVDRQA